LNTQKIEMMIGMNSFIVCEQAMWLRIV